VTTPWLHRAKNRCPEQARLFSREDKQEVFDYGEQRLLVKRF
jgi:hypothetical protein